MDTPARVLGVVACVLALGALMTRPHAVSSGEKTTAVVQPTANVVASNSESPPPIRTERVEAYDGRFMPRIDEVVAFDPNLVQFVRFETDHTLDTNHEMRPAQQLAGSLYVDGAAVINSDVLLYVDGAYINMTHWITAWSRMMAWACADLACHNGGFPRLDCTCDCPDQWIGTECEIHACHGHGVYYAGLQRCACDTGYAPKSMCRVLLVPSTPTTQVASSIACNLDYGKVMTDGSCMCTARGVLGSTCNSQCATPVMNLSTCPERVNWGADEMFTSYGVCGGGYLFNQPDQVSLGGMQCDGLGSTECAALFAAEKAICCAPGIQCTQVVCSNTDAGCCNQHGTGLAACLLAGCAWCRTATDNSGCVALSLPNTTNQCQLPSMQTSQGNWKSWVFSCPTDAPLSICDASMRLGYLNIYDAHCPQRTYTPACLAAARVDIASREWVRLQPRLVNPAGPRNIVLGVPKADSSLRTCEQRAVLRTIEHSVGDNAVRLQWVCPADAWQGQSTFQFYLADPRSVASTDFQRNGAVYYAVHVDEFLNSYCLVDHVASDLENAQLFGAVPGGIGTEPFMRLFTLANTGGEQVPVRDLCGEFRLDLVGLRDGANVHGLTVGPLVSPRAAVATWSTTMAIAVTLAQAGYVQPWG